MAGWLMIGAILIAFLIGGLIVAEYLYPRVQEREAPRPDDDALAPPRTLEQTADDGA